MAGTGSGSLLPLDSLGVGASKTFYGKSGRDTSYLEPLDGSGSNKGFSAALTLPMLKATIAMSNGGFFRSAARLPSLQGTGYMGAHAAVTLPEMIISAHFTSPNTFRLAYTFPPIVVAGSFQSGCVFNAGLVLPALQGSGRGGFNGAGTLPSLAVAAQFSAMETFTAALTLPLLQSAGNVLLTSEVFRAALVLPALGPGSHFRFAGTLPRLAITAYAGVAAVADETVGWMLNIRTGGVTKIMGWPFTQFARAAGTTYAVGPDGLYAIGGDTFAGAPIAWVFETGISDMGSPGVKHFPYLYLDGIIEGEIEITIIDDRLREFMYRYVANLGALHIPHRRKLGNGIRGRNFAIRAASPKGAYIELDSLEPEVNVTQRSIE